MQLRPGHSHSEEVTNTIEFFTFVLFSFKLMTEQEYEGLFQFRAAAKSVHKTLKVFEDSARGM